MTARSSLIVSLLFSLAALGFTAIESRSASHAEADSLLEAAREASTEKRFDEAIAIYERLARENPSRLPDLSPNLAHAYVWAGRLEDARREFHRASMLDPGNFELRLGELLVLNWMGRHLEAWEGYERLRFADVADPSPLLGLAAAQNWAGRRDLSMQSLDVVRRLDPKNADAHHLAAAIHRELETRARFELDMADDSGGFRSLRRQAGLSFAPHPQFRLTPLYTETEHENADGLLVKETRAGASLSFQPWTRARVSGNAAWRVESADDAGSGALTGRAMVALYLHDRLRAEIHGERFARPLAITSFERLLGDAYGGVLRFLPDHRSHIELSIDGAQYDEGLSRLEYRGEAAREVHGTPAIEAGLLVRVAAFDGESIRGIWSPDNFWASAATVEFRVGDESLLAISAGGAAGPSREGGSNVTLYRSYWAKLYRAWGAMLLEAELGRRERDATRGTGYATTGASLSLTMRM